VLSNESRVKKTRVSSIDYRVLPIDIIYRADLPSSCVVHKRGQLREQSWEIRKLVSPSLIKHENGQYGSHPTL